MWKGLIPVHKYVKNRFFFNQYFKLYLEKRYQSRFDQVAAKRIFFLQNQNQKDYTETGHVMIVHAQKIKQ